MDTPYFLGEIGGHCYMIISGRLYVISMVYLLNENENENKNENENEDVL